MMEHISATNADLLYNKYVKVFLKNGAGCEGRVLYWSDDQAVLVNDETGNELFLYSVKENVIMVKVYKDKSNYQSFQKTHLPKYESLKGPSVEAVDYKAAVKATKIIEEPKMENINELDPDLRIKKIADLRKLQAKYLQEQTRKRMKTFVPTHMTPGYYDSPDFTK